MPKAQQSIETEIEENERLVREARERDKNAQSQAAIAAAALAAAPEVAATEQLQAIQDEQQRAHKELVDQDLKLHQHYIRCHRGHIGVFLRKNPVGQVLKSEDWYATYRLSNEPWNDYVYCQVCYNVDPETGDPRGTLVPLQVTYTGYAKGTGRGRRSPVFVVHPKHCFRYPKGEDGKLDNERLKEEGMSRSSRVEYASGNTDWRPSSEQIEKQERNAAHARKVLGVTP